MDGIYGRVSRVLKDGGMERGEARAVALLLLEKVCGLTTAEALVTDMGAAGEGGEKVMAMARRVSEGEPVQYVVGEADFCGLSLRVRHGVLIPRPETEELVGWIGEDGGGQRMLDVCTGSGCVAVALASRFPDAEVEAWDVSEEALEVARMNAGRCGVEVEVKRVDVLDDEEVARAMGGDGRNNGGGGWDGRDYGGWDVVVSNPPYVCEEEAKEMEAHVLEHEPWLALFVPNDDPLRFYRQIARMGMGALRDGGRLYFEINRRFGGEVAEMLKAMGYAEVEVRKDFCGNDRMVKAIKV